MVSVFASSVFDRVKPKTTQLVFFVKPTFRNFVASLYFIIPLRGEGFTPSLIIDVPVPRQNVSGDVDMCIR